MRAAIIFAFVLLIAVPASGQTSVFQFTGYATGAVVGPGPGFVVTPFTNKLVSIQFSGPSTNVGTVGAGPESFFSTGGADVKIIVDGVTYTIDHLTGAMSLRSPDADGPPDRSSYQDADPEIDFEDPGDLGVRRIAIHYDSGLATGSQYYHVFEAYNGGLGGPLLVSETDFTTTQSNLPLLAQEQNRGGFIGTPYSGGGPAGAGYPVSGGGTINFDFLGGVVAYTAFTGAGGLDFGDAPDTSIGTGTGDYQTEALDAGASHFIGGPYLGATPPDAEVGGSGAFSASAGDLDDNTATDDEDGVIFLTPIVASAGQPNTGAMAITVGGGAGTADVQAWIDFNRDGVFEPSELVVDEVDVADGTAVYPFTIPAGASVGTSYARFRVSTSGTPSSFGLAPDGEVEDFQVAIADGAVEAPVGIDLGSLGDDDNPILITRVGGDTKVFIGTGPAVEIFSAPFVSVGTLDVTGTQGSDEFQIDYSSGKVANDDVTLDGQGDDGAGDSIALLSGGVADTIHHTYDDANSGNIAFSPQPSFEQVFYSDFEPITDLMTASNRIFSFNGVVNNVTYTFVPTGPSVISTSPLTSETTTFSNPTATMVINGNGDKDTFDIQPSDEHPITVNGGSPFVAAGLPLGDEFILNAGSLPGGTDISLTESSTVDGVYSFEAGSGFLPVTYTSMEIVALRFSDPNAFPGADYEGDHFYPIHTETGISVEPYFNWDIDNWPGVGSSALAGLTLTVYSDIALTNVVWSTSVDEAGDPLEDTAPGFDHYVTDKDLDGFLLDNNTTYWWELDGLLVSGDHFKQVARFLTLDDLVPSLTYPDDNLTLYTDEILFNWDVSHAHSDDVYWRMDLDAAPSVTNFEGTSLTFVMGGNSANDDNTASADGYTEDTEFDSDNLPSPLVWGTTYSWRVSTMWPVPPTGWVPQEVFDRNETDRMVSMSDISEFMMVTKAIVPTPSYPIGGLTVPTNTPELNWFVGAPFELLTFEVKIFADPLGTSPNTDATVCTASGIVGTQFDTDSCGLIPGTTYNWVVRSTDGTSTSAWSSLATFTTLGQGTAGPAFPSYPVNNLEIYTINPQFHWYTEKDNTGISFVASYKKRTGPAETTCAGVQAGGTSLASALSTTYVDVTGLEPGATYDWCVVSTGLNGSFDSGVATFSVAGGLANNYPVASWPIGNPTVYSTTQMLHWYLEGSYFDLVDYDVEYCIAPDVFGDPGCTIVSNIPVMQYELTGLDYGDVVTWRVRANYTSGPSSDWSLAPSQGSFTVTGLLSSMSAVPTYPVGDLVIYDTDPTFSWYVTGATGVANSFKIQYSYAETFPMIGNVTIEAETTNTFFEAIALIPGHTYWWRVAVSNDGGTTYGAWSTVASFAIHPGAQAVMPRIGGPTNQVSVASATPTLAWMLPAPSESTLVYDVRIASNETFEKGGTVTEFTDIAMPFLQLPELEEGDYYWQVRSRTTDGAYTSPYSATGRFTTSASFSVDTEDEGFGGELPQLYTLGQNYPNPFNPTTTIEFQMAESANVTLRVYNVLGQVVKTLVSGTMPPGTHRVNWDARDEGGSAVSSGLYIYRMETEGFTVAKTLVLMK